jgi:hypothetical protein
VRKPEAPLFLELGIVKKHETRHIHPHCRMGKGPWTTVPLDSS